MKIDVYGRFQLEVFRENDGWSVYRVGMGKRTLAHDLPIPPSLEAEEIPAYLSDQLHELSCPGQRIRVLP